MNPTTAKIIHSLVISNVVAVMVFIIYFTLRFSPMVGAFYESLEKIF